MFKSPLLTIYISAIIILLHRRVIVSIAVQCDGYQSEKKCEGKGHSFLSTQAVGRFLNMSYDSTCCQSAYEWMILLHTTQPNLTVQVNCEDHDNDTSYKNTHRIKERHDILYEGVRSSWNNFSSQKLFLLPLLFFFSRLISFILLGETMRNSSVLAFFFFFFLYSMCVRY